jgi:hypothetical protein
MEHSAALASKGAFVSDAWCGSGAVSSAAVSQ